MSVSFRHLFRQGPVLKSIANIAISAIKQRQTAFSSASEMVFPGPWLEETIQPRSPKLVVDYIRWTGGDFGRYDAELPPHLFPQWGFPLMAKTLKGIPYPMINILNQGCRLTRNAPLPNDLPLKLKARLESIDDNGQRARIHQRMLTGTEANPEAIVVDLYAVVRLRASEKKKTREKPRLPEDAIHIGSKFFHPNAGLDFALLTGDFNPIHWLRPIAKVSGFKSTILHGFASFAIAIEQLNTHQEATKETPWKSIDVRFIRPLVLPTTVETFLSPEANPEGESVPRQVIMKEQSGEIYLVGTFVS